MASISEIRAAGTEILLTPRPIYEPINAPESLQTKLARFGDNYDLSTGSHLFRFLIALCGEAGAGSIKRELLYPKLQNMLESTNFNDLDRLYGDPLALPRLSTEIYNIDPKSIAMTQAEWQDVLIKDSQYRYRCLVWMRAIMEGPTPRGMALAGEAASGIECDVIERYHYLENVSSDNPVIALDIGETTGLQEFIIIPRAVSISESDRRRIMRLVDRLRPVNTITSVTLLDDTRFQVAITDVNASSEYFNVNRYVTGRPDTSWPPVDLSQGYWVERGIEKEAPQFAFFTRQETATFLSIAQATASSEHVGAFDSDQSSLFGHLKGTDVNHVFDESFSFAKAFAPIQLTSPWLRTQPQAITLVNSFYPLGYFAENTITQLTADDPQNFWASLEKLAPETDSIVFDLATARPINFLDFEICQKPIDFIMEYSLDGIAWTEFEPNEQFQPVNGVHYLPSMDYPWYYTEHHFDLITARFVRVTFIRRTDAFPLSTSEAFKWSIELRNLRLAHIISSVDDFIVDTGSDILGNTYRTDLTVLPAINIIDNNGQTFWQSQPNPTPDSVESVYFDLRINSTPGTMQYLEEAQFVGGYDNRGMADMESYEQDGVVIDEIFIDPITFGPSMHIYYSNDDDPHYDEKLWTLVPRNYTLKKGFAALPQPIFSRFIKLEFSHLTPSPYHSLDYPVAPEVVYKRFPSWVQTHFNGIYEDQKIISGTFDNPFDRVSVDPLVFGFQIPEDRLHSSYGDVRTTAPTETQNEIRTFISNIISTTPTTTSTEVQQIQESKIQFFGSTMWQVDLLTQLDDTRAYSRYIGQTVSREDLINSEVAPVITPTPSVQSVTNLSSVRREKELPPMFFPRTCRHEYQVARATRPTKIAYFAAIRDVSFYRRNFAAQYDEPVYFESLDDTAHVEVNDLVRSDWRFVVTP